MAEAANGAGQEYTESSIEKSAGASLLIDLVGCEENCELCEAPLDLGAAVYHYNYWSMRDGEGWRKCTMVHPRGQLSAKSIPVVCHSLVYAYHDRVHATARRSAKGPSLSFPDASFLQLPPQRTSQEKEATHSNH